MSEPIKTKYPSNVDIRPEVQRILNFNKVILLKTYRSILNLNVICNLIYHTYKLQVEFIDGSCCRYDVILFCTGYRYSFPFLDESCKITIDDNHIQPLYKHMIHIDIPSMCFIGIPFNVCTFQMFDLQV